MRTEAGKPAAAGWSWRRIGEVAIVAVLLALTFAAISGTDPASTRAPLLWAGLSAVFCLASLALHAMHPGRAGISRDEMLRLVATWLGVLGAVELVFLVAGSGRISEGAAALVNGLLVGLGAFVSGVHTTWRLAVAGLAIGTGVGAVALIEQYLLLLVAVGIVAAAIVVFGGRLHRH